MAKKVARKETAAKRAKAKRAAKRAPASRAKPKTTTRKKAVKRAKKKVARKAKVAKVRPAGATGKTARGARPKKLKSPLSRAELAKFRNLLLEKRRSILGDMGGLEAEALRAGGQDGAGDLSSMPTHPADQGTDNFEHEFSLGLLESEREMLAEINAALVRIADRTYGICLGTGKPIGKARLTARPWARYSIEYARMVEQGLVRPGEGLLEDQDEEY